MHKFTEIFISLTELTEFTEVGDFGWKPALSVAIVTGVGSPDMMCYSYVDATGYADAGFQPGLK